MKLSDSIQDGVVILRLSGRILSPQHTTTFCGKMLEYLNLGKRHFIVDLGKVELSNTEALRALVGAHTAVKRNGGRVALTHTDSIKELLVLTRLTLLLETHDTIEDALLAFKSPRPQPAQPPPVTLGADATWAV